MVEITGQLDAKDMRLALVVSRFNHFFTEQLVKGAVDCFLRHGGKEDALTLVRVPGANELPLTAQRLASAGKHHVVVVLGAVIQGATPHADLINGTVARALSKIALDTGVPVINGVVCAQNLEQAVERAGTKHGNKGWDAVLAAIETVNVLRAL
ncbi:MAG TPA: 6,7-dimethyl-8-ribityllumazine synthase [Kiritimatiellia bacterium]|nr:6,7-dimethyl-8-ribityllumazine synthase [Kiritimatiellia bacterium]HOM59300.1 6,7-dimethyl-8-ribityllumazine synthase [Kiritimatiellia bacterium]HOR98008.1 6,7-dimethyl-8-ribityllumazine synthase [Kiritimatiellia bacterium]HPC48909.1 6,7-dimethyl-8-ribityllumazine synthase [Kiritimatiellia bacterium]HPK37260.1 6,7-dimethyl-8-ribityllumazine synthase [Kiritimatiellia bacterium]